MIQRVILSRPTNYPPNTTPNSSLLSFQSHSFVGIEMKLRNNDVFFDFSVSDTRTPPLPQSNNKFSLTYLSREQLICLA